MSLSQRPVIIWLLTGAILVFLMTAIGGITRLTESGLSMVDWNLFMGAIPPTSEQEWQETFEQYQQYPEYQTTHAHFELEDFKRIFFWEYIHRLLGRVIGLVFIIPFVTFLIQKRLSNDMIKKLTFLLAVGAFQGFLGWYMVSSGLVNEPRVSHFRLAAHLCTAFFTISYSFWLALELKQTEKVKINFPAPLVKWGIFSMVILALQIMFGAFVAGKDAGMIHNYWPLMTESDIVAPSVFVFDSLWDNLINNGSGIQFMHRNLAYILVISIFIMWVKALQSNVDPETKRRFNIVLFFVLVQFSLGIATLLMHVPVSLGVLHQLGALLLLLSFIYLLSWKRVESISTETN